MTKLGEVTDIVRPWPGEEGRALELSDLACGNGSVELLANPIAGVRLGGVELRVEENAVTLETVVVPCAS